jgi:hypothetical protein
MLLFTKYDNCVFLFDVLCAGRAESVRAPSAASGTEDHTFFIQLSVVKCVK